MSEDVDALQPEAAKRDLQEMQGLTATANDEVRSALPG